MIQAKSLRQRLAILMTGLLGVVAFICANTTSCCMIYQPEAPSQLDKFRRFK
jgi:cyclic lactone autoinducer peptide